jgi:hypothetical protein
MIESRVPGRAQRHRESAPSDRQGAPSRIAGPASENNLFSAGWQTRAIAWICLRIALVMAAFWLVG